jgi:hypothetical protein
MGVSRVWSSGEERGMYSVQDGAPVVRILVRMENASLSLLFPGGFEFAPGPWVGNSWCLLASGVR